MPSDQRAEKKLITRYNNRAGVLPSTLKSIINGDSKNPGIVTIKLLCDGFGMSLYDYFDDEAFISIEPENL